MTRFNEQQLKSITSKRGYGIPAAGIKSGIKGAISREAGDSRAIKNLESDIGDESLGAKKLQVGCSGRVEIRVTFYRRRLADYGEECSRAVSEKALIDSLVYAGLIQGDSGAEIRLSDGGQKKVETDEEERTELEILYQQVDYNEPWIKAKQHLGH